MQNEFEKQVQQKLQELKLVPTDPVWQKVELQIRQKKDRRRLIVWIPLLALFLGLGLWLGIDQYSNQTAFHSADHRTQKENFEVPFQKPINKITKEQKNSLNKSLLEIELDKKKQKSQNDTETSKTKSTVINFSKRPSVQKNSFQKISSEEKIVVTKKLLPGKKGVVDEQESVFAETIVPNKEITQHPEREKNQTEERNPNRIDTNLKSSVPFDTTQNFSKNEKIKMADSNTDSTQQDSAFIKKTDVKKHLASNWRFDLVMSAGFSSSERFEFLFGGGQKSLATAPNNNPGGQVGGGSTYYGPSDIKSGFAFAAGGVAKKKIGKRTSFTTGLRYNYYSNTIQVGNVVSQNRVIMDYAVSQYYSNQAASTSLHPYRNQYHFLSVPVGIDWQLSKKLPLNFYTGLSWQYLVKTNALRFDYISQSYFHNNKAFNRLQLSSEFGLTYSVSLKERTLAFGPQLQHGLSRLEKGNSTYHLLSYGLGAQLQLGKK